MIGPPTTSLADLAKYYVALHEAGNFEKFLTDLLENSAAWSAVDSTCKAALGERYQLKWVPLAVAEFANTLELVAGVIGAERFLQAYRTPSPLGETFAEGVGQHYLTPIKELARCSSPDVLAEQRGTAKLDELVATLDESVFKQLRQLVRVIRSHFSQFTLELFNEFRSVASGQTLSEVRRDYAEVRRLLSVPAEVGAAPSDSLAGQIEWLASRLNEQQLLHTFLSEKEGTASQAVAAIQENEDRTREIATRVADMAQVLDVDAQEARVRLDKLLSEAQRAGFLKGVEPHAKKYEDAARSFEIGSYWWLVVATVIIIVMLVLIWRSPTELPAGVVGNEGIAWVAFVPSFGRLFALLSVSSFAAVWAARNYKANRHNQLVNEHRALALRTMDGLVQAAPNEDSRAHALRAATDTIFGHVPTGYVPAENEATSHPTIVEILRPGGG